MSLGNRREMRCVDNQLASVFNDRAQFVARLPPDPQLIVMFVKQGDDTFVLAPCVADMNLAANGGSAAKSLFDLACEERVSNQSAIVVAEKNCIQRDYPG